MSFSEQIVGAFLAYNYRPDRKPPSFELAFVGEYETKLGVFKVRFSSICVDMSDVVFIVKACDDALPPV